MDDGNKKEQPPGDRTSISIFLQSPIVQRSVCWYNELHGLLLDYCINYVLYSWFTIRNLFYTKILR